LPAEYFKKETESSPIVEVTMPALVGPDQGKPWVGLPKIRRIFFNKENYPQRADTDRVVQPNWSST